MNGASTSPSASVLPRSAVSSTPALRGAWTTIAALILAACATAQSTNGSDARLVMNGVDGPPPNAATLTAPAVLTMEVSGAAFQPFVLAHANTTSVGALPFAGETVDLDLSTLTILMDGFGGTSFLSLFANTGPAGTTTLSVPIAAGAPFGNLGAFQAAVLDPTLPSPGVALTAVTTLTHAPLGCDYGSLSFARSSTLTNQLTTYEAISSPVTVTQTELTSFGLRPLILNRVNYLYNDGFNSPGDIDRFRPPSPERPLRTQRWGGLPAIRTIHGDLYSVRDTSTAPNPYGFLLAPGGGAPTVKLAHTFLPSPPQLFAGYGEEVAISPDSSTLAVTFRGASPSGNSQVLLIRIDGGTFTQNGLGILDVTPAPGRVDPESLHFAGNRLFFVHQPGGFLGPRTLHQVDVDPSGLAQAVTLPLLGTGSTVSQFDYEMFTHEATGDLYFQAGVANAHEDLFRVDGASGSVINLTLFPNPTELVAFGEAYDGSARFAVSPGGTRCAYVTRSGAAQDLWVMPTTGGSPIHVTSDAHFDPAIGVVADPFLWSETSIAFFAGTSAGRDLYSFDITTATLTNLTTTNGQSGAILPIAATPAASMWTRGYFPVAGGFVFLYGGVAATIHNDIARADFATLTLSNLTGASFSGAPGPGNYGIPRELCLAPAADILWFVGQAGSGTDQTVYSIDLSSGGVAIPTTTGTLPTLEQYDDLVPDALGLRCLATYATDTSGDEEVLLVSTTAPALQISNGPTTADRIVSGSTGFLHPFAGCTGAYYAQGTLDSSIAVYDARLYAVDLATLQRTDVAGQPGTFFVFSAGN